MSEQSEPSDYPVDLEDQGDEPDHDAAPEGFEPDEDALEEGVDPDALEDSA